MTKKQTNAVGLLLKAMQGHFDSETQNPERTERTPVHTIPPRTFGAICRNLGVEPRIAYLLATFAMSLARGMMQEPGTITAIVDGADGGTMGAELITQVESLRNESLRNI